MDMRIPYSDTARIDRQALAKLLEDSRLLAYVLANVSYLEDRLIERKDSERYWDERDESRTDQGESMPLREYLECRVAGKPIWTAPAKDEAVESLPDGDDYEERKLAEREPMHYAGLAAMPGRAL